MIWKNIVEDLERLGVVDKLCFRKLALPLLISFRGLWKPSSEPQKFLEHDLKTTILAEGGEKTPQIIYLKSLPTHIFYCDFVSPTFKMHFLLTNYTLYLISFCVNFHFNQTQLETIILDIV